jgi:hypothetical protein
MMPNRFTTADIQSPQKCCWTRGLCLFALLAFGCDSATQKSAESPETRSFESNSVAVKSGTESDLRAEPGMDRTVRSVDWFEDRTDVSQVRFSYSAGREAERNTILETVGGGLGILDIDNDLRPDLFCVGGGTIDRKTSVPSGKHSGLFRNMDGNRFRDVTRESGIEFVTDYSHACVCGDLNSDGFNDIVIICYGLNRLLINQGDGTFLDKTPAAGFGSRCWSTAAALGDVNRDGELDLYITGYVDWVPPAQQHEEVPAPQSFNAIPDHLFLNSADGGFADVSADAGIRSDGMGLGVIATDINEDQRIDFYVANDVVANHLYLGGDGIQFDEAAELSGVAYNEVGNPEGSMGVDCEDVNGDGRDDLWVTNFEMEDGSLYLNLGAGQFQHATTAFRLAGVGRRQVGFGTGLRDFNGDGWPDVYVVNGHVRYRTGMEPFLQPPVLCRNAEGTGFVETTNSGGTWFRNSHAARGAAAGDLNNDGGLDLVISSLTEPVALLYNRQPSKNWVQLQLVGIQSPRTPIGCRISMEAFGRKCARTLTSGSGYMSHSESKILMALESDRASVRVDVTWPSGLRESFDMIPTYVESVLIEGRGQKAAHAGAD